MRRYRLFTYAALLLSLSYISPAFGSSELGLVSKYLVEDGKRYYEQGKRAEAIHALSKVLLVDPGNKEAAYYLKKWNVPGGTHRRKTSLGHITRLSKEVDAYKEEISVIEKEGKSALKRKREEIVRLNKNLNTWKDKLAAQSVLVKEDKMSLRHLEETSKKKNTQLARLNKNILQLKDQLAAASGQLKEKDRHIKKILREKNRVESISRNQQIAAAYRFSNRKKQFKEKMKFIESQGELVAGLKEKLVLARREFYSLKKSRKRGKPKKAAALEKRLRGDYALLQARLRNTQERVRFVEKTMGEKDEQVKDLKEQLRDLLTESGK